MGQKILIIASDGMAGCMITSYLKSNNMDVDTLNRSSIKSTYTIDLMDLFYQQDLIDWDNYDYVINASGILNRGEGVTPTNSIFINSLVPHFLLDMAILHNFQLIHLSTDCVFNGTEKYPYREESTHTATDLYGKSKSLGEIDNNNNAITIRTSIIGTEIKDGVGLLHWFLNTNGNIDGYTEVFWSGVTTLELAKFIYYYIEQESPFNGIFHLTNNIPISKYLLLTKIKDIWGKDDVFINENNTYKSNKSFINTRQSDYILNKSYNQMLIELYNYLN